jgi:F-type H+-transporting ATPase subunit gamma
VIFGSDYGLCGQFNDEIVDHAVGRLDQLDVDPGDRVVAAVGARAAAAARGRGLVLHDEFAAPSSVSGIERSARDLLMAIDAWREESAMQRVLLSYHEHRSSSEIGLRTAQLLPVELSRFRRVAESPWPSRRLPTFTLPAEHLLSALLRQFFTVSLFRAFAESAASEHASRLRSMQAAERNIDQKLDELRADYQRRRQDAITSELLDIVSGYEALSGEGSE